MATVDPTQLPALVTKTAYETMLVEQADVAPPVYPQIFKVIQLDGAALASDPSMVYGDSFKSVVGVTEPEVIGYGQDAPGRSATEGYQVFVSFKKLSEKMVIPEELWKSGNAQAEITRMVQSRASGWFRGFAQKKERLAANVFNKGGYTAGHRPTFDNSYPGHVDPNGGLIYDGKPFFALSGNGHPLYLARSTVKHNALALSLSSSNLGTLRTLVKSTNAVNEVGEFVGGNEPNRLLVPAALEDTARAIVESVQLAGTAQNDINVNRGRFGVIAWEFLDDSDAWFVGRAQAGIRVYDSGDPVVTVSPPDPSNGNVTVRCVSYFGAGVDNFRPWGASNLATS